MVDPLVAMRADFERLVAAGGWSEEDAMEMGLAIKEAIDAGDEGLARCWADWLAAEAAHVPRRARPRSVVRECRTCGNTRRPGMSDFPGHCGVRADLLPAYGPGHPLRRLPADRGSSCAQWRSV